MKKIWLSFAPCVLMIMFLFCGCGSDNSVTELSVDCGKEINMIYGTYQDEPAYARIMTNKSKDDVVVDYDDKIIDYNLQTGEIIANHTGETELKISMGDNEVVVQVNVVGAYYCTFLNIKKADTIKLCDETCRAITPCADDNYNMGFDYISHSPDIATIDENGIVTPISAGEATIEVKAKSGVGYGGYQYIYETVTITVEDIATKFEIEILDKDLQPLKKVRNDEGFDYYELYSSENSDKELYVLKLSSNVVINGKYISEIGWNLTQKNNDKTTRLYDNNVGNSANDIKSLEDGGKIIYKPFFVKDYGTDYFQYTLLDIALNYQQEIESNLIEFKVYKQTEQINVNGYFDREMTESLDYTEQIIPLELKATGLNLYFSVSVNDFAKMCIYKINDSSVKSNFISENILQVYFAKTGDYTISFVSEDRPELCVTYNIKIFEQGADFDKIKLSNDVIFLDIGNYTFVSYKKFDRTGQETTENLDITTKVFDNNQNLINDALVFDASNNVISINALKSGVYTVQVSSAELTTPATLIVNVSQKTDKTQEV